MHLLLCLNILMIEMCLKSVWQIGWWENVEIFEREADSLRGRFFEQEYVGINGLSAKEFCKG